MYDLGNTSNHKPQESLPDTRLTLVEVEDLIYYIILTADTQKHIVVTPPAQRELKVISVGVHIFVYIGLWTKKILNRTLAIDSPFQTFVVRLLVEFID